MRKLLVLTVILFVAASVVSAAPLVACSTLNNLALLIGQNSNGGCISQGVTFSNFSYTGGQLNQTSILAAQVITSLVTSHLGNNYSDGFSFNVNNVEWDTGFTISYNITVNGAIPNLFLDYSKDQINSGKVPNGVTTSDQQSVGVSPNPLLTNGSATNNETIQSNQYSLLTNTTTTTVVVPADSNLTSYEQDFYGTVVPEPVSFVLIGSGLIGLAFLRRRLSKS